MSIASRITEIEQHIGNAYDKLEDLGIDLTNVDKNINNISSMLENVWNEYPKVPATDVEEASLDGTKKGRMNIEAKGNTEQEQLSGKNLLNEIALFNRNTRVTENNGVYSITGNGESYGKGITVDIPAGDYYLSLDYISSQNVQFSGSGNVLGINVIYKDDTAEWVSLIKTTDVAGTRTKYKITKTNIGIKGLTCSIFARFTSGTITFNNLQLATDEVYEPYCRTEYQALTQTTLKQFIM